MAYKVTMPARLPSKSELRCYDTIGEDPQWWDYDWDELLYARSLWEAGKQQGLVSAAQIADLARIDAYWRAHPKAFNRAFRTEHARKKIKTELQGWVEDEHGQAMPIPQSHWWWWPLPED